MSSPRIFFSLFILLLLIVSSVSQAQDFELHAIDLGGKSHLIRYTDASAAYLERSSAALERSAIILVPLFESTATEIPYQIILDFYEIIPTGDVEADAAIFPLEEIPEPLDSSLITEESACWIRVFLPMVTEAYLNFTIAHEMAHCLQNYYFEEAFNAGTEEASGWWLEGTAEWMATLVYPDLALGAMRDGVTEAEWLFAEENSLSITDTSTANRAYGGYGTAYFWHYLAETTSPEAIMAMLAELNAGIVSEEQYQDFLNEHLVDASETMQAFGRHLAQGALAYQPTAARLFGIPIGLALPDTIEANPLDYSVYLGTYYLASAPDVEAVRIVTSGLDESAEIVVSLNYEGENYHRLSDSRPALLCLPPEGVMARFVISRGDGDRDAPFEIQFEAVTDSSLPCDEAPRFEVSAACATGTWALSNNPTRSIALRQLAPSAMVGGSQGITQLQIAEDGSVRYSLDNFQLALMDASGTSGGIMTMDAALTGRLVLVPDMDGTLAVVDFDWSIEALSATATINGFEMDMTNVVLGAADYSDSLAPTPARIQCIGSDFLDWWVVIDGLTYTWHFSRID